MPRRRPSDDNPPAADGGRSKTQIKQQMTALQQLGAALLDLPDAELDRLHLDETLLTALRELRRLSGFEARRRHMQYIGKLMRLADAEGLRAAVAAYQAGNTRRRQQAERWRERLIADDAAMSEWLAAHPHGDQRRLRALVREARAQIARQPQAARGKHYRDLFQAIRDALEQQARTGV